MDQLGRALKTRSPVQRRTLFHDDVTYYSFEEPPESVWAFPAKVATYKERLRFSGQEEHRFVFSTKRHAFDAYCVDTFLVGNGYKRPRPNLDEAHHRVDLVLGPLLDCCRLVTVV